MMIFDSRVLPGVLLGVVPGVLLHMLLVILV